MVPKGGSIHHPLGFNWHPFEGAGTDLSDKNQPSPCNLGELLY